MDSNLKTWLETILQTQKGKYKELYTFKISWL